MTKPLRVLFLMEDLCFGGTQRQNMELAKRLDRSRFMPHVLTLTGATDIDAFVRGAGIGLRHMGASRKAAPFFFARLGNEIRKIAPDILVPCTALPNIWGRIWGRFLHVPVIVGTCRGGGAPRRQHEWLLWRLADGIVCNSAPLVQAMAKRGAPMAKLRYIANGVDCGRFAPGLAKSLEPLIVCVARLAADKDHAALLHAFSQVRQKFPAARLRLVGDGPEEEKLRHLAAKLPDGAGAGVEFAGAAADPAPMLADAWLFALASRREGQPNAVLEAMAAGLPVCATNAGGIPALLEHGEAQAGLVCQPGDTAALAANICALLSNAAMRRQLGANGRARAERDFSFAAMTAAHEDFFEQLWQRRQSRPAA